MIAAGSHVLVTGASRGIGRAVAGQLLARGATVVATARTERALEALVALAPGRVHALAADLSDGSAARSLVDRAVTLAGERLDAVVQCAGVVHYEPVGAITEGAAEEQLAVDLAAPLAIGQAFALHARARGGGGAMVLVGSTLAERAAPMTAVYAAAKAGVHALARAFALELGPDGVRVNAVAPGVIDTDMVRVPRLQPGEPEPRGDARDTRIARELDALGEKHLVGRLGTPDEVAETILFLLDAPFITGAIVTVDGGLLLR
jgi:NAD(P)-dependent dehydrogenase (short-subunit alcohol dehydrogenase family)